MRKRRIYISAKELVPLIENSVREALKETDGNSFRLIDITSRDEIKKHIVEVYNLLVSSYENIGGLRAVNSERDLLRQATLLTIYGNETRIASVGTYNNYLGGNKLFGLGNDGTQDGKYGARLIIQRDIKEWDGWYWCEASGASEYLFKKYGGYSIPSLYASEILGRKDIRIIDDYHYVRPLGPEHEPMQKTIFGFRDQEIYDKVQAYMNKRASDTIGHMKNENDKMNESAETDEIRKKNDVFLASRTIGSISDTLSELQMTDLVPMMADALKWSVATMKQHPEYKNAQQIIELGQYMLDTYPVMALHRFGE